MIISDNLRKELHKVVGYIYDNEEDFIWKFLQLEGDNIELASVSFNEENIHFVFVQDGQHIASSCKIDHFNDWIFRRDNG